MDKSETGCDIVHDIGGKCTALNEHNLVAGQRVELHHRLRMSKYYICVYCPSKTENSRQQ